MTNVVEKIVSKCSPAPTMEKKILRLISHTESFEVLLPGAQASLTVYFNISFTSFPVTFSPIPYF